MKAVLITLALLTTSLTNASKMEVIDQAVEKYYCEYVELLASRGIDIPEQHRIYIGFGQDMPKGVLGLAHGMFHDNFVLISLNPVIMNFPEDAIRWVIFHELSHDLFNAPHGSTILMFPALMGFEHRELSHALDALAEYLQSRGTV